MKFLRSTIALSAVAAYGIACACEVGGDDLCSCSELLHKGLIQSFDDCTQSAAVSACKSGACGYGGAEALSLLGAQTPLPFKYHNQVGPMDLAWGFPTPDTIEMELTLPSSYYIGIGLTADGVGDTIAGWVDESGKVHVQDYWDAGSREPETDEKHGGCRNDVQAISGSQKDGATTIRFRRKLVTGDKGDCDAKIVKGPMEIVYAWCNEPWCADARGQCKGWAAGCLDSPHSGDAAGFASIDFSGKTRADDLLIA